MQPAHVSHIVWIYTRFKGSARRLDVDGFQTCFGSAASPFEIIELAYIHCALKENFSVALTEKGFTCISLICRELLVPRSVAL